MRRKLVCPVVGISIILTVGACESEPTKSELTAPEISEPMAGAISSSRAQILQLKSKGPIATLSFFSEGPEGLVIGDLQVGREESQGEQQTFLFYSILRCDPVSGDCVPMEEGGGLIPNRDFVWGRREARLTTEISLETTPDFQVITGSGGPIFLEWTRTSAFITDFHTQARTRGPGISIERFRSAGTFWSAVTQGSIFSVDVASLGMLGTVRSGTLIIFKGA
jgi:hypothetical protein